MDIIVRLERHKCEIDLSCVYACLCFVLVSVQNSAVHSSLPTSMTYSLVTVPTKVCCTSGGVYSHLKNWMFLFVGFLSVVVFTTISC